MKTRVRVKRSALLKVVEGRVRKAEKDYVRARDAYPAKLEAWNAACVAALEKALAAAKRDKIPRDRYGNPCVSFPDAPMRPSEGRELCNLRRMRETLRMGSEDSLLLSQEDADAYFGPCTR
jgi:hypothetical protein